MTRDMEREVVAMNSDDDDWIVSDRRMLRSTMAAIMASPCEGKDRNVEICFRMKGDGERNYWMFITIPGIATTLKRLSRVGPGYFNHQHDIDEAAPALPTNYDILQNRFRLVSACDQLKGPFPSPSPYFTPAVSCAVLDSTVYCLGGDPNDIPHCCCQDIFYERGGRPAELPDHPSQYDLENCYAKIVEKILSCNLNPPPEAGHGICHNIYTLNMLDPFSGWRKDNEQPLKSPRLTPILVSYQGKLYAFSGNIPSFAFAEVYDPVSHAWTELPPPPFGWLPDTQFSVVPLKGWNKLWVLSRNHRYPGVDCTYDVITGFWEGRRESLDVLPLLTQDSHLISALSRENHMVVYWIDPTHVIYAYNLSTNRLFKGSVSRESQSHNPMSLHHLDRDFFFLIRCDNPLDDDSVRSVLHVTLIQISLVAPLNIKTSTKFPHCNSLNVYVLACFAYPFVEHINITDSYLMSDGI